MKKNLRKATDKVAIEAFRLFVYFASIVYFTTEGTNLKWVGACYKFLTQALFTWVESAPITWLSEGMKTVETYVMWFLGKFTFQEVGLLFCAALASRLAVRLVIECDMLFNRARIMYRRRQQQKKAQHVTNTAEAKFYARNAVSMTKPGQLTPHA